MQSSWKPARGVPVARTRRGGRRWRLRHILIGLLALLLLSLFARYWWREMRWRWIVVHHTASDIGNMEYYRRLHMEERGWSDIAYHFIINNGTHNTAVGQVEESNLWHDRSGNFSTRNWYVNTFGIAIVLVGNFEEHDVPPVQKEALVKLIAVLADRYNIPVERIIGHREMQNTRCPGRHLNMAEIRLLVYDQLRQE
ncbi:MAG: N-acetylmuramoyl-L-alanine amidase [Spirochaetales bacterium]|nr:N-acetylmuramoyl-L-alanine amidase [Leptospiraceae bacterium]MCP5483724.1 N-acetylmuramoyl-L-alanine amidase [Spirochaetales bacterium]MCP5484791.1 N-acetylmuramoyl-L-alanine amidase [Spirochaetales bacterium]